VESRKGVPFLALVDIAAHLGDQIATKPQFWGRDLAFSSQMCQIFKCSYYKNKRLCYGRGTSAWQRDHATRLSVEILQLQNILFEN